MYYAAMPLFHYTITQLNDLNKEIDTKKSLKKYMQTVEEFAKAGMAIIFISSDLNEVIRTSDRILVVRGGQILKDVENINMTQKDIMEIILQ